MTQGLRHKFSHHRFKDRESLGHIPVCTEQGLSPRRQTFTSLILAYKKQRGKKKSLFNTKKKKKKKPRQFRYNNNESNNSLEIKAA
jgi:hypothetical protein